MCRQEAKLFAMHKQYLCEIWKMLFVHVLKELHMNSILHWRICNGLLLLSLTRIWWIGCRLGGWEIDGVKFIAILLWSLVSSSKYSAVVNYLLGKCGVWYIILCFSISNCFVASSSNPMMLCVSISVFNSIPYLLT